MSKWQKFSKAVPEIGQRCKYVLSVECEGNYAPRGDIVEFMADPEQSPTVKFTQWQPFDKPIDKIYKFNPQ